MKKIYYLLTFIIFPILIVLLLLLVIFLSSQRFKNYKAVDYQLEGRKYKLLVADTAQKWEKGLMNTKKLKGTQGMIFIFPDKQVRHFWNKNTYLDLEVYWIDDEKVKGKSYLPSIEKTRQVMVVSSPAKVNKVIELIIR
ncbi:MAG: DUF192 domain-containing protein [Microgenomates group bacterium]